MKKLIALVLCLVMCVSMFAACGDGEPVDTTKAPTPSTTKAPDTTTKPEDSTTQTPDTSDTSDQTESSGDTSDTDAPGPGDGPVDGADAFKTDDIPEAPKDEQIALDKIGATNAGQVPADYTSASATGISSLKEITDMEGTYYLKADISANDTTVMGDFKGVLDGCGYTITTSQALFDNLGGIVRNLNIAGEISYTVVAEAPLANKLLDGAKIINCKSTVTVTVGESTELTGNAAGFALTGTGKVVFANCEFAGSVKNVYNFDANTRIAGGFVALFGKVSGDDGAANTITLINCTVNGKVTSSSHVGGAIGAIADPAGVAAYGVAVTENAEIKSTHEQYAGGILGRCSGESSVEIDFANCYNKANVTAAPSPAKSRAGGMVGNLSNKGGVSMTYFKWCTNYGDITSTYYAGGIVSMNNAYAEYIGCVNYGDITVTDPFAKDSTAPTASDNYAGGVVGYQYSNSKATFDQAVFEECLNYGDISVGSRRARAGGIAGHFEYIGAQFESCVNFGDVTATYVSTAANDADCRLGGITGGGTAGFTVKNCVNFGDVTVSFHKQGQPVGGIIAYTPNRDSDAQNVFENCINYGDITTVATVTDEFEGAIIGGTEIGGIVGMLQNITGPAIIKNCVNVGMLDGYHRVNDLVSQNPSTAVADGVYTFANNYYLENAYKTPGRTGTTYGAYGYGNDVYGDAIGETAKTFTKANIEDSTTAGLANVINTGAGSNVYAYAEVTMSDGVTVVKGIVPVTVAELIA